MTDKSSNQESKIGLIDTWTGIGAAAGCVVGFFTDDTYPHMSWVLLGYCLGKGANWIYNFYRGFTD